MLSILIPTFNYNIVPLVTELHNQCMECDIDFEILVFDDGSKSELNTFNNTINNLNNCVFKALSENIGRSAIRNLLGKHAKFNTLIFTDADTFPKRKFYIKNYITNNLDVINGGIICTETAPKKQFKLRWLYTKHREFNALCSSNFLIKKSIFEQYPFDEAIKTYGYEDVLFFENLKKNNINILKIDNPLIHASNDDYKSFIDKTELAICNLITLLNSNKLQKENFKVAQLYNKLKRFKLVDLIILLFKLSKPLLIKNFNSSSPSLLLFDFYRLGYFCTLKKTKK